MSVLIDSLLKVFVTARRLFSVDNLKKHLLILVAEQKLQSIPTLCASVKLTSQVPRDWKV